jgi:hypothetical protein
MKHFTFIFLGLFIAQVSQAALFEVHLEKSSSKGRIDGSKLGGAKRISGGSSAKAAPGKSTRVQVHVSDVAFLDGGSFVNSTYATIHITSSSPAKALK